MLGDSHLGRVEECGCPLDLGQFVARTAVQQAGGGQESTGVQKDLVAGGVGGDDHRAGEGLGVADSPYRFAMPRPGCDDLGFAGHVGQGDHHQPVARPCVLMQAGVLVRREHHTHVGGAVQEALIVGRE